MRSDRNHFLDHKIDSEATVPAALHILTFVFNNVKMFLMWPWHSRDTYEVENEILQRSKYNRRVSADDRSEEQTAVIKLLVSWCSAALHVVWLQSGSDSAQEADSQRLSLVFGTVCSTAMSARHEHIHFEILITIITAVRNCRRDVCWGINLCPSLTWSFSGFITS